jgi:hypothetical protein
VLHNSAREARESISAFTHELGRGHRRKRRSSASNALADESGRLRKSCPQRVLPAQWSRAAADIEARPSSGKLLIALFSKPGNCLTTYRQHCVARHLPMSAIGSAAAAAPDSNTALATMSIQQRDFSLPCHPAATRAAERAHDDARPPSGLHAQNVLCASWKISSSGPSFSRRGSESNVPIAELKSAIRAPRTGSPSTFHDAERHAIIERYEAAKQNTPATDCPVRLLVPTRLACASSEKRQRRKQPSVCPPSLGCWWEGFDD